MASSQTAVRGRGALTREGVVAAATELVEREGLAALNMRRVAEEFGVTPMSLYRYVRDKDELLDAVLDALIDRRPVPKPRGRWRRRVVELMSWLREELERHPDVLVLRLNRPLLSRGALTLTERVMAALVESGLRPEDAARAYRVLFAYTFGYAAYGPGKQGAADQATTLATLLTLPNEEYPVLRAAAPSAAASMAADQFRFGLDAILDGLEPRRR